MRTFTRNPINIARNHSNTVGGLVDNLPPEYKPLIAVARNILPDTGKDIDKTVIQLKDLNKRVSHEVLEAVTRIAARELQT